MLRRGQLRGVLADAVAAFYLVLSRYTLDDLVRNREALAAVLFRPQPARAAEEQAA